MADISVTCVRLAFANRCLAKVIPSNHPSGRAAQDKEVHKCWHYKAQSKEKDPTIQCTPAYPRD